MAEPATAHEPYYNEAHVPDTNDLKKLRAAAAGCEACHLWMCGTQTVFGEGDRGARVMMIGEQPGDKEDLTGKPFVGPAGQELNKAMEQAGLDRTMVYVTNAVKHFKWEAGSGGKRIHGKPNRKEVLACKPWLDAEIASVQPDIIVLLGATAAQALLGADFRLTQHRGEFFELPLADKVIATIHPSAILRMRTSEERMVARADLVKDLKLVVKALKEATPSSKFKLL